MALRYGEYTEVRAGARRWSVDNIDEVFAVSASRRPRCSAVTLSQRSPGIVPPIPSDVRLWLVSFPHGTAWRPPSFFANVCVAPASGTRHERAPLAESELRRMMTRVLLVHQTQDTASPLPRTG